MANCGICVLGRSFQKCYKCQVCMCIGCGIEVKVNRGPMMITVIFYICKLCTSIGNFTPDNLLTNQYCRSCECVVLPDFFVNGKCLSCIHSTKWEENKRHLLPHRNARPVIMSQFIPEIALIIFDYYYMPRRYYEGEP